MGRGDEVNYGEPIDGITGKIRTAMMEKHITQAQMAKELKTDQSTVSRSLSDLGSMKVGRFLTMLQLLDMDIQVS